MFEQSKYNKPMRKGKDLLRDSEDIFSLRGANKKARLFDGLFAYPQMRYAIRKCSSQYLLLKIDLPVMRT